MQLDDRHIRWVLGGGAGVLAAVFAIVLSVTLATGGSPVAEAEDAQDASYTVDWEAGYYDRQVGASSRIANPDQVAEILTSCMGFNAGPEYDLFMMFGSEGRGVGLANDLIATLVVDRDVYLYRVAVGDDGTITLQDMPHYSLNTMNSRLAEGTDAIKTGIVDINGHPFRELQLFSVSNRYSGFSDQYTLRTSDRSVVLDGAIYGDVEDGVEDSTEGDMPS